MPSPARVPITLLAAAAVAGAGCQARNGGRLPRDSAAGASARDERAQLPEDWLLSLRRTECFGTCPVYTVEVDAAGQVRYSGEKFVDSIGTFTDTVSSKVVSELDSAVMSANLFALKDRYVPGENCEQYHTDAPSIILRVRRGGRDKQVELYLGCSGAPAVVAPLAARIDSLLGTDRWKRQR
jgi:hypothetical protein